MEVRTFISLVMVVGPLLALAVAVYADRTDPDGEPGDVSLIYAPVALMSVVLLVSWATTAVLHADVPAQDPCSLLEPYSWQWWLLGCYWGSAK